jgi:uroporphyrinogen-III decarboxylase
MMQPPQGCLLIPNVVSSNTGGVMNGFKRIYSALSGLETDCVPFMPKIWVKLACEITNTDIRDVISDSYTAMKVILDAGKICKADGVRAFWFPERCTDYDNEGNLQEIRNGKPVGRIDTMGGLSTYLYDDNQVKLEDEYTVAFLQFYKQKTPLVQSIDDVKRIRVPQKSFYRSLGFDLKIRKLINESEGLAIAGNCGSATLSFYSFFRNASDALMDFYDTPELVHALMDKGVEIALEKGKFCIDNGLDILRLNDSSGNMNVISPAIFREFIKPRYTEICKELHNYKKDVRIYCHNCGNILPVMEDLVETGLDCIAPLDPLGGFSCADARRSVSPDYPLMGGIDTLSFINKDAEGIINEARECIESAGRKSFILGSGCVLPPGSKPELIIAAAGAAHSSYID